MPWPPCGVRNCKTFGHNIVCYMQIRWYRGHIIFIGYQRSYRHPFAWLRWNNMTNVVKKTWLKINIGKHSLTLCHYSFQESLAILPPTTSGATWQTSSPTAIRTVMKPLVYSTDFPWQNTTTANVLFIWRKGTYPLECFVAHPLEGSFLFIWGFFQNWTWINAFLGDMNYQSMP